MMNKKLLHRLAAIGAAVLTLGPEAVAGPPNTDAPVLEAGTVDTVAGPGFCMGRSVLDPESRDVRSLAVVAFGETSPPYGDVLFETGSPGSGQFGLVYAGGYAAMRSRPKTVYALMGGKVAYRPWGAPERSMANGLAVHPVLFNEVHVATNQQVLRVQVAGDINPAGVLAGEDSGTPLSSGDGGPAVAARFRKIESLAGDGFGNLYLADRVSRPGQGVRIRFFNHAWKDLLSKLAADHIVYPEALQPALVDPTTVPGEVMTIYPGSRREVKVAPEDIDAVAGGRKGHSSGDGGPASKAGISSASSMAVFGPRLYIASFKRPSSYRSGEARVRLINLGGSDLVAHGLTVKPGAIATVAGGARVGFAGDKGPARSAAFSRITGMVADGNGNLYMADQDNHRIRKVNSKGVITTFAGTRGFGPGEGGFNGNDRPAVKARLNRPFDVKQGPEGRVYISDQMNGRIRYVDEAGFIHAGGGTGIGLTWRCPGQKPLPVNPNDEDAAIAAAVFPARPGPPTVVGAPAGLTAAGSDGVLVAAPAMGQIKLIEPSGAVSKVAGGDEVGCPPGAPCPPGTREGAPAHKVRLVSPTIIAAGPSGGVYVFDHANNQVRFVNRSRRVLEVNGVSVAAGAIRAVAGSGVIGSDADGERDGDGRKATAAQVSEVTSLATDGLGNLFVAEPQNHRLRVVDKNGMISTYLGPGGKFNPGSAGCCPSPSLVAIARHENLYVYDGEARRVFFVNRGTSPLTVHGQAIGPKTAIAVAGNGGTGFSGDSVPALTASFTAPTAMAPDKKGNLYVADGGENTVRKIDSGGTITTVLGTGKAGFNGDGLKGQLTALNGLSGIALDSCGNLLVSDSGNDRVRRLNLAGPCGA